MKNILLIGVLVFGFVLTANADVWKWVDAEGKTHFVDTMTTIYTWVDETGEQHYSDTPDHEDAVAVDLVWHSKGSLADLDDTHDDQESGKSPYPGETAEQFAERQQAEEYYCRRATEIYDSYVNAPQLYRTNQEGEREYLSKQEKAKMIAETRAKKDELCS